MDRKSNFTVTGFSGVRGVEVVGEKITGQTSGATALVKDELTVQQGSVYY